MHIFRDMMATSIVGSVRGGIIFWKQILEWADKDLLPWFHNNLPGLEGYVRNAFYFFHSLIILTLIVIQVGEHELELISGIGRRDITAAETTNQQTYLLEGWQARVLPEDRRADLQDLRRRWLDEYKWSGFWFKFMTIVCLLQMFKAHFQIVVENKLTIPPAN